MAGVNDLVAFGFGSWSTVEKVPTWGFGIGAAAAGTQADGLDYTVGDHRLQYQVKDNRLQYEVRD